MATKRKPKNKNEVTVSHLKAWIEGIEEFQEAGWVPNAAQWKKIREKIDQLVETEPEEEQEDMPSVVRPNPARVVNPSAIPPSGLASTLPPPPPPIDFSGRAPGLLPSSVVPNINDVPQPYRSPIS